MTYDWLAKWNDRLAPAIDAPGDTRFVHNDLHAGNTMVLQSPLRLSAVIDWGDACWGDPVLDMERVPIWATPWLLESYQEATGLVDEVFVGRVLAHVLGTTLYKACDPEFDPTDAPWHPVSERVRVQPRAADEDGSSVRVAGMAARFAGLGPTGFRFKRCGFSRFKTGV